MTKKKSSPELLSQTAYAKHAGINRSTVSRQIRDGIIPTIGGKIDRAVADKARASMIHPLRGGKRPGQGKKKTPKKAAKKSSKKKAAPKKGSPAAAAETEVDSQLETIVSARLAHQMLQTEKAQFELDQKKGLFVLKEEVRVAAFKRARYDRDAWLNWPNRISAILAAKFGVDERKLYHAIQDLVEEHLEELASADLKTMEAVIGE